jgi:organic hydroperoxide reductase OsmC/OhrA
VHKYQATIHWELKGPSFATGQYSREHTWTFDGGVTVPASPSPAVVKAPWSNPANVDPEEAFVAAIASCHMLTFLWLASKEGFQCDNYHDEAVGTMAKNSQGKMWVNKITLQPAIAWGGDKIPTDAELASLHHRAHEECFIANSVLTEVVVGAAAH